MGIRAHPNRRSVWAQAFIPRRAGPSKRSLNCDRICRVQKKKAPSASGAATVLSGGERSRLDFPAACCDRCSAERRPLCPLSSYALAWGVFQRYRNILLTATVVSNRILVTFYFILSDDNSQVPQVGFYSPVAGEFQSRRNTHKSCFLNKLRVAGLRQYRVPSRVTETPTDSVTNAQSVKRGTRFCQKFDSNSFA